MVWEFCRQLHCGALTTLAAVISAYGRAWSPRAVPRLHHDVSVHPARLTWAEVCEKAAEERRTQKAQLAGSMGHGARGAAQRRLVCGQARFPCLHLSACAGGRRQRRAARWRTAAVRPRASPPAGPSGWKGWQSNGRSNCLVQTICPFCYICKSVPCPWKDLG